MLMAGFYGILHDQLTYSICPEYFTRFKFIQFGLTGENMAQIMPYPRISVAVVGFLATWWTGIFIGLGIFIGGFRLKSKEIRIKAYLQALSLVLLIALLTGVIGGIYGYFYLAAKDGNGWLPPHIEDVRGFITVGTIHNFSYLGGLLGLIAGIVFLRRAGHYIHPES